MKAEIAEMEKCVQCLALELPEAVHKDVRRIWNNLKEAIEEEQNPNNSWYD
jgi:hypothetical protein